MDVDNENRCAQVAQPGNDVIAVDRDGMQLASATRLGMKICECALFSGRVNDFLFSRWTSVAAWRWTAKDEHCGICRSPNETACNQCTMPGAQIVLLLRELLKVAQAMTARSRGACARMSFTSTASTSGVSRTRRICRQRVWYRTLIKILLIKHSLSNCRRRAVTMPSMQTTMEECNGGHIEWQVFDFEFPAYHRLMQIVQFTMARCGRATRQILCRRRR